MRTLIMVFIILLSSLGKTAAQERVLEPFTLQLRWTHQAQFMGYYAAEALGYYESEGLTVDLRPGGFVTFMRRAPRSLLSLARNLHAEL